MIRVDCQQGTPEWTQARLGIPTASQFDRIVTASGKPSKSAERYMCELLAEKMLGHPVVDWAGNDWTHRGTELETEAVRWYEFERDTEVEAVGFVMRDDRQAGCSPDRLVGNDGLLQIKCPSAAVHVSYLLGMDDIYKVQVQGELYICEREWSDLVSYHPSLPRAVVRVHRDDEFIAALAKGLDSFIGRIRAARGQLEGFVKVAEETL